MDIVKTLVQTKNYAPVVIGATVGLVGASYVMDQAKAWMATAYPGNDWATWGLYLGITVAAVAVYVAAHRGKDWASQATAAGSVAAMAVGGFSVLAKALQWTPITVGRIGAVRGVGARPMNVVRREVTPTYAAAPAMGDVTSRF